MSSSRGEENHVIAVHRKVALAGCLAQHTLAPVPEDGVSKPLSCDEGDPSRDAFVEPSNTNSQERVVESLPTREDPLKFSLGFDGLHRH